MAIESESPAGSRLPGVSVSQAFGLPDDWTLASSLKGEAGTKEKLDVEVEKSDEVPDPDKMDEQKAAEKEQAEEKQQPDKPDEPEVESDRKEAAAAEKDRKDKESAAATKKAEAAAKKAEKPEAKKTAEPTNPAPKAAPEAKKSDPKVEIPALDQEKKIKVGGKEYTEAELAKKLEGAEKPVEQPKPEAQKTPEQVAQAAADEKKRDQEWIASTSKVIDAPLDEATLDTILTGGKEAVEAMQNIRRQDIATTLLSARKDILTQLSPIIEKVTQMEQRHIAAEDARVEAEILTAHPEMADHRELMKQHAWALSKNYPDLVKNMTQEQFNAAVVEHTTKYIQKFNPGFGSQSTPAAATPEKQAAAKPAAVPARRVSPPPPAGNTPGGSPTAGGKGGGKDFARSAISTLL